ncbi:MAG: flagellin [Gammaproteobacteria bacterium]|nr:MAG: flagellin [Gammaproteobacteria bacterium]
MALVINTNISSLNAQRNVGKTSMGLETSIQRLSTGLRINSAKDDAAGLGIVDRMTSQIRGLNQAVRNANDAVSLAQTAEGAMQESTNILQRMRELAVQSANDSNSGADRVNIQKEITQLAAEMNRIASQTTFNGNHILDGTFTGKHFQVGANANETISVTLGNFSASSMGAFQTNSILNVGALSAATDADTNNVVGDTITVTGKAAADITYANDATAAEIAAAFQTVSDTTEVTASASTSADIQYATGVAVGESITFELSAVDGGAAAQGSVANISYTLTSTTDYSGLRDAINAESNSTGITATLNSSAGTLTLTNADGHNIFINAVSNGTADDAVLNVGATATTFASSATLTNDTTTAANTDAISIGGQVSLNGSSGFSVTGTVATFSATDLNATLASVADVDVSTRIGSNNALEVLDKALRNVSDSRADLGAIQNRLEFTISNLSNVSENISAARSRIQDTDFAAETANLTRNQILQQAGIAMLSQANSAPQAVLSLLQ